MDIFEELRKTLGCMYISDMRFMPYRRQALGMVLLLNLDKYPIEQLSDLSEYLTDKKISFESSEQALAYFKDVYQQIA